MCAQFFYHLIHGVYYQHIDLQRFTETACESLLRYSFQKNLTFFV